MAMSFFGVLGAIVRLSKGFWTGPGRWKAWALTIGAFAFTFVDVAMQVRLNAWTKAFFDSIEKRNLDQLWQAAILFLILAAGATASIVAGGYARQMLQVYWRRNIGERLVELWLKDQAFYRLNVIRGVEFAPEARIAEDARGTVEPIVDLVTGFVSSVASLVAFVGILWTIGGTLSVAGVAIPGFMVWGALVYAVVVSLMMIIAGGSYAQRLRERSEAEAQMRYELTRLRENAESVALVRGEDGERKTLMARISSVVDTWRRVNRTWGGMTVVVYASGLAAPIVPVLLMAPKYLSDPTMTFGTVMQAAAAFGTVQGSLAWVTSNFSRLSEWYAAASRVAELSAYIHAAAKPDAEQTRIEIREVEGGHLQLDKVAVRLHTGRTLIADAAFTIAPGDMVMVTGKSGTGKSTLIRAIAGLWPWGSGAVLLPRGARLAFVPQRPYMPLGTLKAALTYPENEAAYPDEAAVRVLESCDLKHLVPRLHEHAGWDRVLSGGEQQRVSFARLLLHKPDIIILDEATSALDDANQARLMELFRTDLTHASVISVAHRTSLARYHNRQITLSKQRAGARAGERLRQFTGWANARWQARKVKKAAGGESA